MREVTKILAMITAAVVVGLLIGAGILFVMAGTGIIKGDPGKVGLDGLDGLDGIDGIDGIDGLDGRDGKDGVNGSNGRNGDRGQPGPAGRDAPLNKPSIISIVNMSCSKATCYKKCNYAVVATILDPDDIYMVISIFYDAGEGYIPVKEVVGSSGIYEAHVLITVPMSMQWIIKVWDGQDITVLVQDVVIL